MTLLCLSDIHGDAAGLGAILPEAAAADCVIVAGDITQLGGREDAEAALGPLLDAGMRVLAVGGNMDGAHARAWLAERSIDIHGRGHTIDGVGFMGLGGGTRSPFGTPWEIADGEAAAALEAGWAAIADAPVKVLVAHAPPRDTEVDRVRAGLHAGSAAVRRFLETHDVAVCICGHIHQAGGRTARVGGCTCMNVGPFKGGRYALVSVGEGSPSVTWRTR
jgi:uncharacterized protein